MNMYIYIYLRVYNVLAVLCSSVNIHTDENKKSWAQVLSDAHDIVVASYLSDSCLLFPPSQIAVAALVKVELNPTL